MATAPQSQPIGRLQFVGGGVGRRSRSSLPARHDSATLACSRCSIATATLSNRASVQIRARPPPLQIALEDLQRLRARAQLLPQLQGSRAVRLLARLILARHGICSRSNRSGWPPLRRAKCAADS